MKNPDMIKRYTMFMAGVIASALGISLITKAGLGTSPVTSPAFVLTFLFPFSLGTFTMMVNTLMFGLQAVILGRDFERVQLLQLPSALLFSACIDGWSRLFSFWPVRSYLSSVVVLAAGCVFLGLGIALEVVPDVLILPGEGLVRAIVRRFGLHFGHVKRAFDLILVLAAAVLSAAATGKILGIREGTVAAALVVGPISHFFIGRIHSLARGEKLVPEQLTCLAENEEESGAANL